MSHLATGWSGLRAWSASHDAELRLCVRSTTAAVLTLAAAQLLHLPIALWAVLTAVILTQINVGRSLKASTDYLLSTLGGAVYAGAIGALVPQDNQFAVFAALAMALAPAVLLAALYPRFSAAPFTGFTGQLDPPALADMQNRIGEAFARFDKVAAEAAHERITRLSAEPDQ